MFTEPNRIKYKTYKGGKYVNTSYTLDVNEYGDSLLPIEDLITRDLKTFKHGAAAGALDEVKIYVNNELYKEVML